MLKKSWLKYSLLLVLLLLTAYSMPSFAEDDQKEPVGEILSLHLPPGFTFSHKREEAGANLYVFYSKGNGLPYSSGKIVAKIHHVYKGSAPQRYVDNWINLFSKTCIDSSYTVGDTDQRAENGYYVNTQFLGCSKSAKGSIKITRGLKAISGKDAFYTVEFTLYERVNDAVIKYINNELSQTVVCDDRSYLHPCPVDLKEREVLPEPKKKSVQRPISQGKIFRH